MKLTGVDLEHALHKARAREEAKNPDELLRAFKRVLEDDDALDERVINNIFSENNSLDQLNINELESERIFTLAQIKKLCTTYRLRFLDTKYFKGEIPYQAIAHIKRLQKEGATEIKNFKIIAPAHMFNLEYKDKDPLLFIPLGNQRYYLVHKWGNDLSLWRKLLVFPFRSFKTLLGSVAFMAAFVVSSVPSSLIMGPYDVNSLAPRIIFFFYLFIAFSGLTALYGFSRMKNFNSELWNSKYMD